MRSFNRQADQLRPITLTPHVSRYAEGSCLISCGHTKVLCTASIDERTAPWLRDSKSGWVTAEYGMLPRATESRNPREAAKGKQSGRTQEIQRLIGRSLRAGIDLALLGERQITIDCDVLEADGGTRCASITGGYVALYLACDNLVARGLLPRNPILTSVAAISCGITKQGVLLDLDYPEDMAAEVDANFVMTGSNQWVEIQASAEESRFNDEQFAAMMKLARQGLTEITALQDEAIRTPRQEAA